MELCDLARRVFCTRNLRQSTLFLMEMAGRVACSSLSIYGKKKFFRSRYFSYHLTSRNISNSITRSFLVIIMGLCLIGWIFFLMELLRLLMRRLILLAKSPCYANRIWEKYRHWVSEHQKAPLKFYLNFTDNRS